MTLLERANTTEEGYNYVSPYLGLRDICLSQGIHDVYYFSKSHNYLCVYEDYICLKKSKQDPVGIDSDTVWIKSVEGVKKVIPLNLRTIICIYDSYVEILDGLVCLEHRVNIGLPIINAFAYSSSSNKHIKLGVIYLNSKGGNSFKSLKLSYVTSREQLEVRSLVSPYFFTRWNDTQISKLLISITEPILHVEVINNYTQIITSNSVWLVGGPKVLSPYKNDYKEFDMDVPEGTVILYKSFNPKLDSACSYKSLFDVAC